MIIADGAEIHVTTCILPEEIDRAGEHPERLFTNKINELLAETRRLVTPTKWFWWADTFTFAGNTFVRINATTDRERFRNEARDYPR